MIKDFRNKKHQPVSAQDVRNELAEAERKRIEDEQRPIREAEKQLHANSLKLFELGRTAVLAHRPDPEWELPKSAAGLSMPQSEVDGFVAAEAARFVAENADCYVVCKENYQAIMRYLADQKTVLIPNADVFKAAFERLSRLDLLRQKPEPTPEPEPTPTEELEQIKQEAPAEGGLIAGFDLETGQPRQYSQKEIWKMSSADLKKAFKMWVTPDGEDRRPRINRSYL